VEKNEWTEMDEMVRRMVILKKKDQFINQKLTIFNFSSFYNFSLLLFYFSGSHFSFSLFLSSKDCSFHRHVFFF
jgi:hypothetical protein